jgi:hypothetical protein
MTVTEPFPNPTASCDKSSRAVKAEIYWWLLEASFTEGACVKHTGNGFRPLLMLKVDWQVGRPVFFTGLSKAQTFKTGSFGKSSYTV